MDPQWVAVVLQEAAAAQDLQEAAAVQAEAAVVPAVVPDVRLSFNIAGIPPGILAFQVPNTYCYEKVINYSHATRGCFC